MYFFRKINLKAVNYKLLVPLLIIGLFGIFFRLYHIEFGLPQSFPADEQELAEPAIKYTYEIRNIIETGSFYKLIPTSFVYGTVPVYSFTFLTMLFSKVSNIFNVPFTKTSIYIFLRVINALVSLSILVLIPLIYKNVFSHTEVKRKLYYGIIFSTFLVAFNWKLIVHAHYLNPDIITTILVLASIFTFIKYIDEKSDTKYTVLTGIFLGLAFGTKVTVLLALPLYIIVFLYKRDYRNMFAFLFVIFGAFVISNPFSLAFANKFAFRVFALSVKENGLVFDSVDFSKLKYINAVSYMITPVIFVLSLFGMYQSFKLPHIKLKNFFLIGSIVIYIVFFTTGTRRVDRWLLPILPIFLIYASYGFVQLEYKLKPILQVLSVLGVVFVYLYFPLLLLSQYQRETPRSAAYYWLQENTTPQANKLVITEQGNDPMHKLKSSFVIHYRVYESENAQYSLPEKPEGYDYVVLASRPMENFKRAPVKEKFPFYYDAWNNFDQTVQDPSKFSLVKSFELPKPNLIEASDIFIYESIEPQSR